MGAFTSPAVRAQAPACWFPLAHADAIRAHPGLVLSAVVDTDSEAAARASRAHGEVADFTDVQAMLQAVRPDLLAIATRTPGRAGLIQAARDAGVRALHVEKPLCNSMVELADLETALAAGDTYLTLGAIRRRLSPYRAAISFARSGALGALLEVQMNLGAAPLYWSHPHAVDLILAVADGALVLDVSARFAGANTAPSPYHLANDPIVETATIRFVDGLVGRIGRAPGSDLLLVCEQAILAVNADGHRTMLLAAEPGAAYPQWSAWEGHAPGSTGEGTLTAISELVGCLDGDPCALAANAHARADMLLGQRLLFAIAQSSAEGGRPVDPAHVNPAWVIDAQSHGKPA